MKNIHVLPTDKPSRLQRFTDVDKIEFELASKDEIFNKGINIYITSSEEIKEGDYWIYISPPEWKDTDRIEVVKNVLPNSWFCKLHDKENYKKVILTTDQDLIADGVQGIDDEFLEWFVKNKSCEEVEVYDDENITDDGMNVYNIYKIIIPKEEIKQECECTNECLGYLTKECKRIEEPKQETLEEASERALKSGLFKDETLFIAGSKWFQDQLCNSEIIQRIKATKSDAEARRIIKSI